MQFVESSKECNSLWKNNDKIGEKKAYYKSSLREGEHDMADRQQFLRTIQPDPELAKILAESKATPVTEEELRAQRISFAFGNAPYGSENRITN